MQEDQAVTWAIDGSCSLRTISHCSAAQTMSSVEDVRTYDRALRGDDETVLLIDGVVVTHLRSMDDPRTAPVGRSWKIPERGWLPAQVFANRRGVTGLFEQCGDCAWNVSRHRLAECVGQLQADPDCRLLEELIDQTIQRLRLGERFQAAFALTRPLWYGLWLRSPLEGDALEVLDALVTEIWELRREGCQLGGRGLAESDLGRLLSAIRMARQERVGLHVELSPPKRNVVDLETVFPHCPGCKAGAYDQKWARKVPTSRRSCSVCGTSFSPAETGGTKRTELSGLVLRDFLDREHYHRLVVEVLSRQGCREVENIAARIEATFQEETALRVRFQALRDRQQMFLQRHVFRELSPLTPPASGVLETNRSGDQVVEELLWYDSDSFAEVLRRVTDLGVKVRYMTHVGHDDEFERHVWEGLTDPQSVLTCWRDEGCSGKFAALLIVPEHLMEEE